MRSVGFHRFIFVFTLLPLWVLCSCMSEIMQQNQNSGYIYAESSARLSKGYEQCEIKRKIYIRPTGNNAVFSEILSLNDLAGYSAGRFHYLSEYLEGDSLFMYDSADSASIALSVKDINQQEADILPESAAWMLLRKTGTKRGSYTDTIAVAGYRCHKETTVGGYIWLYEGQPMALQTNRSGNSISEQIVKYVPDTLFPKSRFIQPSGFRKLLPSAKPRL